MKLLFTSDWHLCLRTLSLGRAALDQTEKLLQIHRCPLVHCGDLFGDRGPANPIDVRVTNFAIEMGRRVQEASGHSMRFNCGNHDMISGPDGVPSSCPLLRSLGADVADDDWGASCFGNVTLWMVPYFRDPKRQKDVFQNALKERLRSGKGKHVLAFHNEIKGASRNHASKGEGLMLQDIGSDKYDLCVAGHIHKPQRVGDVYFVGPPYSLDWSEANQRKRFLLVEI